MHHTKKTLTQDPLYRASIVSMLALAFIVLGGDSAFAVVTLCDGILSLKSDIAKGISTLGVIGIAIGAIFGKVSWGMATLVAVGIASINSAGTIASYFNGQGCPGL